MKVAIIADVHSNYLVFKKAIGDAKKRQVDKYIFLGDYISDGFDANNIIKIIKQLDHYAINGNREISIMNYHKDKNPDWDKYIQWNSMKYSYMNLNDESLDFIQHLDIYQIVNIENKKICLSHGTPYNVRGIVQKDSYNIFDQLIKDFDCDIYLFGHGHTSFYTYYKNRYFINPGSIGIPLNELPFKYGILNIDDNNISYELIDIDYSYEKLKKYYLNSDYYKYAPYWCSLVIQAIKTGKDHQDNFIKMIGQKSQIKNIDISKNIPNDLFVEVFDEYQNKYFDKD